MLRKMYVLQLTHVVFSRFSTIFHVLQLRTLRGICESSVFRKTLLRSKLWLTNQMTNKNLGNRSRERRTLFKTSVFYYISNSIATTTIYTQATALSFFHVCGLKEIQNKLRFLSHYTLL